MDEVLSEENPMLIPLYRVRRLVGAEAPVTDWVFDQVSIDVQGDEIV